jgi:hypothetical protein
MGDAQELQVEGSERDAPRQRRRDQLDLVAEPRLRQLPPQDGRHEGTGIDRAAQHRPQMHHRAHLILVGMGDHEAKQAFPLVGEPDGSGTMISTVGLSGPRSRCRNPPPATFRRSDRH